MDMKFYSKCEHIKQIHAKYVIQTQPFNTEPRILTRYELIHSLPPPLPFSVRKGTRRALQWSRKTLTFAPSSTFFQSLFPFGNSKGFGAPRSTFRGTSSVFVESFKILQRIRRYACWDLFRCCMQQSFDQYRFGSLRGGRRQQGYGWDFRSRF